MLSLREYPSGIILQQFKMDKLPESGENRVSAWIPDSLIQEPVIVEMSEDSCCL